MVTAFYPLRLVKIKHVVKMAPIVMLMMINCLQSVYSCLVQRKGPLGPKVPKR